MVVVAIADVTAFAVYMGLWFPNAPRWIWVLMVIVFIAARRHHVARPVGLDHRRGESVRADLLGARHPGAAHLLNAVVITAAVSAINADTFGAGRMMFALARQGQAPAALGRTTARGVPIAAVLIMIGALAVGVVLNAVVPESAFAVVASLATFATVWVWLMILLAHLGMRRRMGREGAQADRFPVPLWPVGPWLAVAFIVGVIVLLAVFPATRIALLVGVVWLILLGAAWAIRRRA